MSTKPSGAQNRARNADKAARDDDARALIPLRLANLDASEQAECRALLARLFDGSLGEPDNLMIDLPNPGDDTSQDLGPPQTQRARRIALAESLLSNATEDRDRMSALRFLARIDGTNKPDRTTEREVVWGLVERVVDLEWTTIGSARETTSETECRMWRAQIRRLRGLLLNSADDVAEFRKVGSPVIGVIIRPHDKTADKIGRMSRINLYAQEMAAVALRLAALNPLASPSERHAAVTKSVSVLALNYQPAETSEWAEKVIELTNDPEGGAKVLGIDTEAE
jgi:hypothetical protein